MSKKRKRCVALSIDYGCWKRPSSKNFFRMHCKEKPLQCRTLDGGTGRRLKGPLPVASV